MANRIQDAVDSHDAVSLQSSQRVPTTREPEILSGRISISEGAGGLAIFAPLHYERNYAYPLLVWLHGPDDNERQLQRIMPHVSLRNYVAVAPRGPDAAAGDAAWRSCRWSQSEEHIETACARIADAIQIACHRYRIARDRVFVAGYGCGGTMAFRFAFRHPEITAGVLSLGGALPTGGAPLHRLKAIRHIPVLLAIGRDSRKFGPTAAADNLRLLHAAGMRVHLRQYPCDDCITTNMLGDADRWVMDQINVH